MKKTSKPRKKLSGAQKLTIGILVAVLVIILAGIGGVYYMFSRIGYSERVERHEPTNAESTQSDSDPGNLQWDSVNKVYFDENVTNILLIGQDTRDGSRQRSDSMIIASINKNTNQIILTSLMRDLYVEIPDKGKNRINAAYAFGGSELLDDTIESNFNVRIDANVEVDFDGFKKVIDSLGGVDIELNPDEVEYLSQYALSTGMNHLNGEEALAYSRIRYVGNNDYERTERQRKVLMSAYTSAKQNGLLNNVSMINELFPLVTTDLSTMDIISQAGTVLTMNVDTIETGRIPEDREYSNATIDGMMVLVPDLDLCRRSLVESIYGVKNVQTGIIGQDSFTPSEEE
ncbi:MAG: LCP family protein [Butyricicoccaceae bacterium]